nr:unnamed protein product [Callosobruchus chinensis]
MFTHSFLEIVEFYANWQPWLKHLRMHSVCVGMKNSIFWMTAMFVTSTSVNTQQLQFPQQKSVNNVCPTYRDYFTMRNNPNVDDIALKDVPAMLQLVTYHAGHRGKIIYIGHSLGTTAGIIFASEYPNTAANTIGLLVLLTPAYKLPNMRGNVRSLTRPVCLSSPFLMVACLTILNLFLGPFTQIAPETIPVYFNQIPGGTSLKSISYLTEATRNQFRKYNYGTGRNRFLYGNDTPPDYDIKKIKVPVYIMFARHDWSISREDCIAFYKSLPKEVRYGMYEIRNRNFNHYDFLFGRDSKKLVTDILTQVLDRYVAQQTNDKTSS